MSTIIYIGVNMAKEEKTAWVMLLVAIGGYVTYLVLLFNREGTGSLTKTPYRDLLLWIILGSILANIVLTILVSIIGYKDGHKKDLRDREIYGYSEYIGHAFIVMGGLAALFMALYKVDYFWIANVLFLGFVLSGVLSSIAKIAMYRTGVPRW